MRVIPDDSGAPLRVLHIENQPALCYLLEQALQSSRLSFIYNACHCFENAMVAINEHEFDLIVLDLCLWGTADLQRVKACSNAAPTIVWSQIYTYGTLRTALEYGASGYIGKHEPMELFKKAVETVHEHKGLFVSKQGQQILAAGGLTPHSMRPGYINLTLLSGREWDVLDLLAKGYDGDRTARKMSVKRKTIDTFRRRIREKLQLNSTHALLFFAMRWGQEGRPLYMRLESELSALPLCSNICPLSPARRACTLGQQQRDEHQKNEGFR